MRKLLSLGALACVLAIVGTAYASQAGQGDAAFDKLVDAYYAEYPAANPVSATDLGLHEHDGDLPDETAAGIAHEVARLKGWQKKLAAVDEKALSPFRANDLAALRAAVASWLVEYEVVQSWKRLPDHYCGLASRAVYVIIKRDYAPAEVRLRAVIARAQKIPAMLEAGKHNLQGVSKVAVDIALDEIPDIKSFFQNDVPLAFSSVNDAALKKQLADAGVKVVQALDGYAAFVRTQLQPHASAPVAIGEAAFKAKLAADELITTPIDELLKRGEAELHRLQAEFRKTAAKIDPGKPFAEVQLDMQKDHGKPERLIADTQARLAGLRAFLVEKNIVSLPSERLPRVEETPPFMRATTMASMDTPGPFEQHATLAYFNVTLPEKGWPAEKVEDFLRGAFNRPLIDVVSIHEAFPGHYTQFIWLPQVKSKVRKFESVSSNAEGWAHYCEQMMLDEGYGSGDLKLRLAQLQDALLRAARYVVGIRMHTRGMTFEQAVAFFHDEGYQSKEVALIEARRGTEDPTYLYYTLGKLEVLKLRDDYKKKLGASYSLKKFHDAFLAEGAIPLPLVRRALLQ